MKLDIKVVGPTVFTITEWAEVKKDKELLLVWLAQTEVSNVVYLRALKLRWGWPPIIWLSCFTDIEEFKALSAE